MVFLKKFFFYIEKPNILDFFIIIILILGGAGGRNYTSWSKCHPQNLQNCHIGSHHFENPESQKDGIITIQTFIIINHIYLI